MKVRVAQSTFALGEFSPLLAARSDLAQYRNGAERLLNRRLLAQGGTDTRPAFRLWDGATAADPRLLPYIFNADQRYLIALTAGGFRAWRATDGVLCSTPGGAPWTQDQLRDITWVQASDTLFLFHPSWPTQRIRRSSATAFVLDAMPVEFFPFDKLAPAPIAMTPSALTGAVQLTLSSGYWTAMHLGLQVQYRGKRLLITGIPSVTVANATWMDGTDPSWTAVASGDWGEQAWSPIAGYPRCGAFIDGRLAAAGTALQPNMLWISRAGAFFNFAVGTDDGDAIAESIRSGTILQMADAERLLLFTDSEVWAVKGATNTPVTPKNVALRRVASTGSRGLRPEFYDAATMFLDRTGATLREVQGDESTDQFTAEAVSTLAAHLIRQPIAMTVLRGTAARAENYLMMVTADGALTVFHSIRQEKIAAFVPWETDGQFRDVCAVGSDLFVSVRRGSSWFIEHQVEDAAPLDCSDRAVSGSRTRLFGGFGHLAGRTVGVSSRGHDLGDVVVSPFGTVVLPETAPAVFEVEAGLRYRQVIRPMPLDLDLQDGASRGLMKRLLRVMLQVDRSGQMRAAGRDILLKFAGDDVDNPPPRVTGIIEKRMMGVSKECQFNVEVVGAEKVTVLGLTREVSING